MATYYQKTILASLINFAFFAVMELKEDYNINVHISWRRLIKKIEKFFGIPDFFKEYRDYQYDNIECNIKELPQIFNQNEHLEILRKLIEFCKINAKEVVEVNNQYDPRQILFNFVNKILPEQFDFHYYEHKKRYPIKIDLQAYLISKKLNKIYEDGKEVWEINQELIPKSVPFNKLSWDKMEGIFYIGGTKLLDILIKRHTLEK
ncbi:hypothetical protein D3C74_215770 [compost metagenome]